MTQVQRLRTTRRTFLALCAAVAGAAMLPTTTRLQALRAFATNAFQFTTHERKVLMAVANRVAPGGAVNTRLGTKTVPSAGDAGAVDYIELLLQGSLLFAAGTQRPPYATLPLGVVAGQFPSSGAVPLWKVKAIGWLGDAAARATRPYPWPGELARLQGLYQAGVAALDAAAFPLTFDTATSVVQNAILAARHAQEVGTYNANPASSDPHQGAEGNQPFFLTLLDHVVEACFGDPVYGGNKDYVYWDMINFSGPSYISPGGPTPGQGWTWKDMTAPFDRTKPAASTPPPG